MRAMLVTLVVSSCMNTNPTSPVPKPEPVPVRPVPKPEPEPVPADADPILVSCQAACANLSKHQCPGHEGTPGKDEIAGNADDVSCSVACYELSTADPPVDLHTECVSSAPDCEAVAVCSE